MKKVMVGLKKIPNYIWIIILVSYLLPILINEQWLSSQLAEMRWFFLIIPVFFFSYYFGLRGGMISSLISNGLIIIKELIEKYIGESLSLWEPYMLFIICLISFSIAFGIGLLANRLTKKQQELTRLSVTDPLTKLYNRRYIETFGQEKTDSEPAAVIFLDLDRFKFINDSLGHHIGDFLLQSVAKRLEECIDPSDTTIRIGGDEFVIVTHHLKSISDKADQVLQKIAEPFHVTERDQYLSASIGISVGVGTIHQLIEKADIAMNRAKLLGKNRYEFFEDYMTTLAIEKNNFVNDLHKALDNNELVVYFQPKVDVRSNIYIGLEALVRWLHPDYGMISPEKFVPIAEDTGLIIPIGEWVLRQSCYKMKKLITNYPHLQRISVNISARQFQSDLVETVRRILDETDLPPYYLELEITESILLFNFEEVSTILSRLKKLGIYLSVDDFGTGYSSLNYLKRLPIDCLKIDKSFVSDMSNDPSIVRAIIMLGQSLGLHVIAEGVETKEQEALLQKEHCHCLQGYFYSKPIPFEELEVLMLERDYA